ncbi:hypothetical protein BO70DRAFT_383961 [Aspergillus heteromorphus CBS 117.55]|uniref:Uncharacterized protein n=1 Tax=Aspergillus heteromorphus CBS 117.55 TaxID=1448321 RepID=A0A317X733_9EURO|nr:uncharacterized protein BO70DRAFT_383961 [Aspergillus heteromorphus CBS 117.55]PWY92400.1 hypothetical protein BO70DRAFT_383961 [Aspergillus heteromorphus CBS 117.55]
MSADEGGGTASVPTTNGEQPQNTPEPSTLATPGKRKRVSSHDDKVAQDAGASAVQAQEKAKLQETLRNLVEILSKNDTDLHLLSCPLPLSPAKPRSKRAKMSGDKDESSSIQVRVASDRYNSLSEFLSDIEKASAAVIERNKAQATVAPADGTPLTETVNRIAAFKKQLNSLVRQAHVSQSNIKTEASEEDGEAPAKSPPAAVETRSEGLSLTLFGNPANPKQLYSSLQKTVKVPLSSDEPGADKFVEVQAPLPEVGLPNGITTTKVQLFDAEAATKGPKRTFGEVFAPRSTLPQLEAPRKARASTRNTTNGWIDPFEAITDYKAFLGDRNNYCLAPLPSGQWLQYGGVTSSPSSYNRRPKQQSSQQPGEELINDDPALGPDEDAALLQGVYSSFAPSFDSSGSVVQVDSKNLVWWSKRGARRLHTLVSIPLLEEAKEGSSTVQPGNIGELDESTLEEMVKTFNPEDFTDNVFHTDKTSEGEEGGESREMSEVLGEVSELLETLSSYQRIRNLEPVRPTTQSTGPKETTPENSGSDTPSEAEQMVYETLKSSLATVVSTLPPYAVAKLDGNQLADLNISQKILIENPDYSGTMEKDDYALQQERAMAMGMPGGANRTSTPSRTGSFQAPPPYNQRAYTANAANPRPPPQAPPFQAPQPYYPGRQNSASAPYTPGGAQSFGGARPPSTPQPRPGYFPAYAQVTPYNAGNTVPQYQRPGQNGYHPYPAQQGSPQPYTPRPGQPAPYNASYAAGAGAGAGAGRSASPQKPPAYATPRGSYIPPGSANPQQRYVPQQQPGQQPPPYGNYPSNQAPPPSGGYSNSAAAMTYARSAAEQAIMMERNKAQLAAAAQHRPSSATPQPVGEGTLSQDRSVTPGGKPNGTPIS